MFGGPLRLRVCFGKLEQGIVSVPDEPISKTPNLYSPSDAHSRTDNSELGELLLQTRFAPGNLWSELQPMGHSEHLVRNSEHNCLFPQL